MRIPTVRGIIDRRILVNYRIDPTYLQRVLPEPFRPKTVGGAGIGGICLIRLRDIRPPWVPRLLSFSSENAAHRIAVEWEQGGRLHSGVYIPRRDSDSRMNALLGGRLFPGVHHHARFDVMETNDCLHVSLLSDDQETRVTVTGNVVPDIPRLSIFGSLPAASDFFETGAIGYSPSLRSGQLDGLELRCRNWRMEALSVEKVGSSYFEDSARFPRGTVEFDCALLMRGIEHEWRNAQDICCEPSSAESDELCCSQGSVRPSP
jgi:hypothetical protein